MNITHCYYELFIALPLKVQIVRDYKMGPKGKVPWMEYNGMVLCDSQLCMEYLIAELNLDVDAHLSTKERAVSTSFQRMADEHTYW